MKYGMVRRGMQFQQYSFSVILLICLKYKTGAIMRMSERLGIFIINIRTTKQSDCSKNKKVCVYCRHS